MPYAINENPELTVSSTGNIKRLMARAFSYLFLSLSLSLAGMAIFHFVTAFMEGGEILANGIIKTINFAVVSLAIFELGLGISKEYTNEDDELEENIFASVRRSITRFVAVVCVALVLEGLIMVIKYSQLELAGNLYYPVAIIVSASILLLSLGGFLKLTDQIDCHC